MKSPFTGGEVTLKQEKREFVFRKESFSIINHYYVCNDTGEDFTTTKLDELNISQVYNQYRVKYGIPFPDEIIAIREQYGLSATKMSQILGFGDNQYRLYENGEMPSESNGKQIASIQDCKVFRSLVERSKNQFNKSELKKIEAKINCLDIPDSDPDLRYDIFGKQERSEFNGFAKQSIDKVINMIVFFTQKCGGIFPTKLNKLLFYSDFLNFRISGTGISGLTYRAIDHGPVPARYSAAYESIEQITKEFVQFPNGIEAEKLTTTTEFDPTVFSKQEMLVLNSIYKQFRYCKAGEISELSHKENAWIKNNEDRKIINYFDAFELKGINIPDLE